MKQDEVFESMLKKAIQNGVELSGDSYFISKIWAECCMDKCVKHLNDNRCCICKECLLDIQKNGKCDGNIFVKREKL